MEELKIKKLLLAVQKNDFEHFKELLSSCEKDYNFQASSTREAFSVNHLRNTSGDSALHIAARHGSLTILK